jgi:hypothetical protein
MRASRERPAFPQHDPAAFRFSFERVQAEAAKKREAGEAEERAAAAQRNSDAWCAWVNGQIMATLTSYNKGVAEIIVKWREQDQAMMRAEIEASKTELRAEIRTALDEAMVSLVTQMRGELKTAVEDLKQMGVASSSVLGLASSGWRGTA